MDSLQAQVKNGSSAVILYSVIMSKIAQKCIRRTITVTMEKNHVGLIFYR